MTYENQRSGNGGVILLKKDTEEIGRLTYTLFPDDNKLIITYVLVHPKNEGKGLGKYLVNHAIEFARENNWNIYPHCSYARSVMNRMPEVEDILLKTNT